MAYSRSTVRQSSAAPCLSTSSHRDYRVWGPRERPWLSIYHPAHHARDSDGRDAVSTPMVTRNRPILGEHRRPAERKRVELRLFRKVQGGNTSVSMRQFSSPAVVMVQQGLGIRCVATTSCDNVADNSVFQYGHGLNTHACTVRIYLC